MQTKMIVAPFVLAMLIGCGGNKTEEPATPDAEPDTGQEIEEAADAVGEEIEGAAEDVEEGMEDAVDDDVDGPGDDE